jgi:hypothetical protein
MLGLQGVLDLWGWLSPPKRWYALSIYDPRYNQTTWRGPRYTTDRAANNWHVDEIETHWQSRVTRWIWDGVSWVKG